MVSGSDRDPRAPERRDGSDRAGDARGRASADRRSAPGSPKGEGAGPDPIDEESLDAVLRDCPL